MPKLIILRGNSGSGKTTLARALQEKFGPYTMLISQDMVRIQILHGRGKESVQRALPLLTDLLKYGRKHSEITILEGILEAADHLPLFEAAIREYGAEIYAYYYDLPFEETLLRHSTKPNRFDFGEEEMRRWWKEKDFIGIIPEIVLHKDVSLEDAVERIYRHLTTGKYNETV